MANGKPIDSDQSTFSRGIRDLDDNSDQGKFEELEVYPSGRRDPEESRYNEAGLPIVTQGDLEMKRLKK